MKLLNFPDIFYIAMTPLTFAVNAFYQVAFYFVHSLWNSSTICLYSSLFTAKSSKNDTENAFWVCGVVSHEDQKAGGYKIDDESENVKKRLFFSLFQASDRGGGVRSKPLEKKRRKTYKLFSHKVFIKNYIRIKKNLVLLCMRENKKTVKKLIHQVFEIALPEVW